MLINSDAFSRLNGLGDVSSAVTLDDFRIAGEKSGRVTIAAGHGVFGERHRFMGESSLPSHN